MARKRTIGPGDLDKAAFADAMASAVAAFECPPEWKRRLEATSTWALGRPESLPHAWSPTGLDDSLAAALAAAALSEAGDQGGAAPWLEACELGFRSAPSLANGPWINRLLGAELASRSMHALASAGAAGSPFASAFRKIAGGSLPVVGWALGGLASVAPEQAGLEFTSAFASQAGTEWISSRLPTSTDPERIAAFVLSMGEPWLLAQPEPMHGGIQPLFAVGEVIGLALGGSSAPLVQAIRANLEAMPNEGMSSHYFVLKTLVSALPYSGVDPETSFDLAARVHDAATRSYMAALDAHAPYWASWLMNDCLRVIGCAQDGALAKRAADSLIETFRTGAQGKYTLLLENLIAAAAALRSVGVTAPEAAAKAVRLPALVVSLDPRVTGASSASLGGQAAVALAGVAEFCTTLAEFDRDSAADVLVVLRDAVERALERTKVAVLRESVWPFLVGGKGMCGWDPGTEPNWETGAQPSPQTVLSKFVEACAAVGGHEGARSLVRISRRMNSLGAEAGADALCRVVLPGVRSLLGEAEDPVRHAADARWTAWPGRT